MSLCRKIHKQKFPIRETWKNRAILWSWNSCDFRMKFIFVLFLLRKAVDASRSENFESSDLIARVAPVTRIWKVAHGRGNFKYENIGALRTRDFVRGKNAVATRNCLHFHRLSSFRLFICWRIESPAGSVFRVNRDVGRANTNPGGVLNVNTHCVRGWK